jgi:hypothetical protein
MRGGEKSSEAGAKQHQQGQPDEARAVYRDLANAAQAHLGVTWIM